MGHTMDISNEPMTTELFHVVTWSNYGAPDMERGRWFFTRPEAEQHAAKIVEVLGARISTTIATTSECQRLGI